MGKDFFAPSSGSRMATPSCRPTRMAADRSAARGVRIRRQSAAFFLLVASCRQVVEGWLTRHFGENSEKVLLLACCMQEVSGVALLNFVAAK
jgi:hypothetical protein